MWSVVSCGQFLTCKSALHRDEVCPFNFHSNLLSPLLLCTTVESLYEDTPEMMTSPLIRTPTHGPSYIEVHKTIPEIRTPVEKKVIG